MGSFRSRPDPVPVPPEAPPDPPQPSAERLKYLQEIQKDLIILARRRLNEMLHKMLDVEDEDLDDKEIIEEHGCIICFRRKRKVAPQCGCRRFCGHCMLRHILCKDEPLCPNCNTKIETVARVIL